MIGLFDFIRSACPQTNPSVQHLLWATLGPMFAIFFLIWARRFLCLDGPWWRRAFISLGWPIYVMRNWGKMDEFSRRDSEEYLVHVETQYVTNFTDGSKEEHEVCFFIDGNGVRYSRTSGGSEYARDKHPGISKHRRDWKQAGALPRTGNNTATARAAPSASQCWDILGIPQGADELSIRRSYRELAKRHHPDVGGSATEFARISKAKDDAMAWALTRKSRA